MSEQKNHESIWDRWSYRTALPDVPHQTPVGSQPAIAMPAVSLNSYRMHLNIVGSESCEGVRGNASVGHQNIDFVCRADERRTHHANLAGIGDHHDVLRLTYHRAEDSRFVRLNGGDAALCVHAAGANESLVHEDAVEHLD